MMTCIRLPSQFRNEMAPVLLSKVFDAAFRAAQKMSDLLKRRSAIFSEILVEETV